MTKAALPQHVKKYLQPSTWRSLWQLSSTLTCYVLFWVLAYKSLSISYWLTLALALVTAFFKVRTFIISHDCGHGSFFKSKKWNKVVGRITGLLTLTPFYFWSFKHSTHHRVSGNLDHRNTGGDIWMMTAEEYANASMGKQFLYKLYRNPIIMFFVIAPFYFSIWQRFCILEDKQIKTNNKKKLRNSIYLTNLSLAILVIALCYWMGLLHIESTAPNDNPRRLDRRLVILCSTSI